MFFGKSKKRSTSGKAPSFLARKLRAFVKDDRGVNLVEFAIAAPFVMALYMGTQTAIEMESVSSQVGKVTSTVADIISQSPTVDAFAVENAFDAADSMLSNAGDLEMYVAGIQITSSGTPVVLWSRGNKQSFQSLLQPAPGSIYNRLPDALKNREGFIVAAHGLMNHETVFAPGASHLRKGAGSTNQTYQYSNFFVPRVSILTLCDGC